MSETMQFTARYVVMQDGEMFAECATKRQADRAFEQAAQPGREVEILEVEPYEVEYQ